MRGLLLAALIAGSAVADFVHTVHGQNGAGWLEHNSQSFLSLAVNHVNNGGQDDGVGGRERAVCVAATNNTLCGDSLNFAGKLNYAPYNNVTMDKYGNNETLWAQSAISRLQSYGYNSISGWSARISETAAAAQGMYYFHLLDMGVTWPTAWSKGLDFDVWSSNYSDQCEQIASIEVAMRADDPYLIAWQTDNEINWNVVGLECYLSTYANSAGGAVTLQWLATRYNNDISALNAAWKINASSFTDIVNHIASVGGNFSADDADFQGVVVDRYLSVATAAIRKYDQNHMISGVRFAISSPQIVVAAAKYCDIIDQHDYSDMPNVAWLAQIYNLTGKPVVLGEFSFTAADSNLPNTVGARANHPCTTQTGRTAMYRNYVSSLYPLPFIVGTGWWNFVDEPATGRWPDGEDSNYGLFTLADDPYSILTSAMTDVNKIAWQWHQQGYVGCTTTDPSATKIPLNAFYSATRYDHFVTTTDCYECDSSYVSLGVVGFVYSACVQGAVPLNLYYNDAIQDNALLVTSPLINGYTFVRVEGYALPAHSGEPGMTHNDFWAVPLESIGNATAQGYTSLGDIADIFVSA